MPVALLCASLLLGQATQAAAQSDPREQVVTAIAHGIRLLETKAYARFVQEFLSPLDMKNVMGSEPGGAIDPDTAARFGTQKAPQLLQALRDAQKATPVFEANGQTAIYALKTPIGTRSSMAFTKVGNYWVHAELTRACPRSRVFKDAARRIQGRGYFRSSK